ncbi:hypothetical protein RRG08_001419 [Elysia crispata]|uniref:Uncharacterized protein n=1 Tax=Elysia crispata TaxID=231223 RepID=A0AAE0ZQJ9_9GAST|nr:hypothetical protein RRG08_001419 [Elysia crispata]
MSSTVTSATGETFEVYPLMPSRLRGPVQQWYPGNRTINTLIAKASYSRFVFVLRGSVLLFRPKNTEKTEITCDIMRKRRGCNYHFEAGSESHDDINI